MRINGLTISVFATAALLICGAQVEAKAISCPPAASGGSAKAGETDWSHPYRGPLVSVELRTESSGDRKGEATVFCVRSVGTISMRSGRCRLMPGPGGRITAKAETGTDIVTCTLLGATDQTNDHACIVMCD
jgi:hypothetical protein